MITVGEIADRLKSRKYSRRQGRGFLAKRWGCTPEMIDEARRLISHKAVPKILLFDVETAPMRAYVWGRWKQNISLSETISEWYMLCWSAKWLYAEEVMSDIVTPEEAVNENDSRIVESLWRLVDEADIVIAYNGKRADIPWMNTRFVCNGLIPPSSYHVIDPCEEAKKNFRFSSNKLDALATYFNIEHKMGTDFSLWDRSVRGDKEALEYMSEYCSKDVKILEEVYLILRPYIKNHPNIGNWCDSTAPKCSHCGSENLTLLGDRFYYTSVGKYQLYRCNTCGAISRGRINLRNGNKARTTSISH